MKNETTHNGPDAIGSMTEFDAERVEKEMNRPYSRERVCTVTLCGRRHYAKGFCQRHYRRWSLYGDVEGTKRKEHQAFICSECSKGFSRSPSKPRAKHGRDFCTRSCLHKYLARQGNKNTRTHGMSKTRPYRIWAGMMRRCHNKNDPSYHGYGSEGITVCDRWRYSFECFWEDMGSTYADNLSIDRIDGTKNYSPDNCRWADNETQGNNRKDVVKHFFRGQELSIAQIARLVSIKRGTIYQRVSGGMSIEEAVTKPIYYNRTA